RFQDYQPQKVSCSARHMDQMMPDLIPFDTATENIPSEEELNRIEDEKFDKLIGGTPSTFKKLSDVLEKFEIEFGKGLDGVTDPDFTKSIRGLSFQELQQKFKISFNEATDGAKDAIENTKKAFMKLPVDDVDAIAE